jgi:SynChlorMet cassette radical SAM/SPASM protein ScmF
MNKIEDRGKKNDLKNDYPLKQIYFYLTEGCNLACRHCWLSPKHQNESITYPSLSVDIFKLIIDQAKRLGLNGVKLTGGEPLMHPEISKILRIIKDHDIIFSIETNGVLCTPKLAKKIASCKKPFAAVSLDGADAKTHEWVRGKKGCFEAAINGIGNLVNEGIKTQIIITVMKHNKDQLEPFVRLAESLGASSVKFNLVQPTGRGEKLSADSETLDVEELLKLGQFVNNTLSASTNLKLYYGLPAAFRTLSKMFGENGDGCSTCGIVEIIGVLSNGSYALCGIGNHIPELVFGHASTVLLEDIWKNNEILNELREGIPSRFEGICGCCHMKRLCAASCIAQNYYRSKSLWEPYWFCDEAYSKGLFPKTRISQKPIKQRC